MKKLVVVMVFLMSVGVLVAGGGEACKAKKSAMKNVELTGKLVCRDGGSGADCARVFRVANAENTQYAVCDKTKPISIPSARTATPRFVSVASS